jgi:hypothetical protein
MKAPLSPIDLGASRDKHAGLLDQQEFVETQNEKTPTPHLHS